MNSLVGSSLGPYQILDQIGMGGMATVYRAYQGSMDRYVAIKVLPQQMALEDTTFLKRFEQEARTIAKLEHRNILPVYDYGETEGYTYLVMRYVDAGTLKDLVEDGPVESARAVRLIKQVAEALDYAHQNGVIHRDVKPSNILVDDQDHVYLMDFGIAKLLSSSAQFTGTDMLIGTPAYMSPEQAQGQQADGRSDIYSLGVMLFEMVTGQAPYEAETPMAVMLKHIQSPLPPPRTVRADLPGSVERIILRAMAKAPEDRFQTGADMAVELERALQEAPTTAGAAARVMPDEAPTIAGIEPAETRKIPAGVIFAAAVVIFGIIMVSLAVLSGGSGLPGEGTPILDVGATNAVLTEIALGALSPAPPAADDTAADEVAEQAGWSYAFGSAYVNDMVVVEDTIYAATGGGLVRWTTDGQATHFTPANGLPFLRINALSFAPDGSLWLGGHETGIARVMIEGDTISEATVYTPDDGLSGNIISTLLADGDTLWAGIMYGEQLVSYFDGAGWRADPPVPLDDPAFTELGDFPAAMTYSAEPAMWIGMERGLAWLRPDAESWDIFPTDAPVHAIYTDIDGAILVAEGDQVWRTLPETFPEGEREFLQDPEDPCTVIGMLQTADRAYWFACEDRVIRLDRNNNRRASFGPEDGLPGYLTGRLLDTPGGLGVATSNGIAVYDGQRWTTLGADVNAPTGWLAYLQETADGRIWAANQDWEGMAWRYDPASETWQTFDFRRMMWGGITGFVVDTREDAPVLWVTSEEGGFGQYRTADGRSRTYGPDQGFFSYFPPLSLVMDVDENLWVGMIDGVYRFEPDEERFTFYDTAADGELLNRITSLYVGPDGTLWAGHRGLEPADIASINDRLASRTLEAIDIAIDDLSNMPAAGEAVAPWLETMWSQVNETYARMEAVWVDEEGPRQEAVNLLEVHVGELMNTLNAFVESPESSEPDEIRAQAHAILDAAVPLPQFMGAFIEARLSEWNPTPNYVYRYEPETDSFIRLSGANSPSTVEAPYLSAMMAYGDNGLLVSVSNDALYEWDGERWSRLENLLSGQQMRGIAVGPDDHLWVISPESGLYTQDNFGWFMIPWQEGPGTAQLYDLLFAADGSLWIGAENGLIHLQGKP